MSEQTGKNGVEGAALIADVQDTVLAPSLDPRIRPLPSRPATHSSYGYAVNIHERSLHDYVSTLRRFRVLILVFALIGFGVGTYLKERAPIYYEGAALLNAGAYSIPLDGPLSDKLNNETRKSDYLESLMPLVRSNMLAQIVLSTHPDIVPSLYSAADLATPSVLEQYIPQTDFEKKLLAENADKAFSVAVLQRYLSHISAIEQAGPYLLRVRATASRADLAARIANAHADGIITLIRRQRLTTVLANVEFLQERHQDATIRVQEAESRLIDFAREHSLLINESGVVANRNTERYEGILKILTDASHDRAYADGELRERRRSQLMGTGEAGDWQLQQDLIELQNNYAQYQRLSRSHPALVSMRAAIERVRDLIQAQNRLGIRKGEIKKRAAAEREQLLRGELKDLKSSDAQASTVYLQYSVFDRQYQVAKEALQQVQQRLDDAMMNMQSDQKSVHIIDAALPLNSPIPSSMTAAPTSGLIFGILLAVISAIVIDSQNARIRSAGDLSGSTGVSVLGIVPKFSRGRGVARSAGTVVDRDVSGIPLVSSVPRRNRFLESFLLLTDGRHDASGALTRVIFSDTLVLATRPHCQASEAFRHIRATLKCRTGERGPRTILVTSAQKGDGKTTVACNLAVSLAQTGSRTLLIDADLRLPSVHHQFGFQLAGSGLVDLLTVSDETLEEIMIGGHIDGLSVLLAGSPTDNPAEILGSVKMERLIEEVSARFDYVIIDTPPVTEIADALLLSSLVDGVVFVARGDVTPTDAVEVAVAKLQQVHGKVLGTVLNGVDPGQKYGISSYRSAYYSHD